MLGNDVEAREFAVRQQREGLGRILDDHDLIEIV
jgi:hypothetical protein